MASMPLKRLPALPADVVDVVSVGGVTDDVNGGGIGVVVDIPPVAEEELRFDLRLVSLSRIYVLQFYCRLCMNQGADSH